MHRATLLTGLLLATPAHAARHEVSFDFQGIGTPDGSYASRFSSSGMPTYGLRAGYAVLRNRTSADLRKYKRFGLVVDLAWNRGFDATWLGDGTGRSIATSLELHALSVGAKADVDVGNVWYPYVRAAVGVDIGTLRVDDDTRTVSNPNQISDVAANATGQFLLGFELMISDRKLDWPVTAAFFVEAGYRLAAPMQFAELGGEIDLTGPVVHSGIGLRF